MPRILVADDNSNIHRAVALALKDVGAEVIAVGNGEAAVRKIAEVKPDLVLADIFMPVRSGYEVCEFVKQDQRFAGVPVVLLIGAFDPFDEREAQRVHADAILKKPFVPADSLIRTVADLLAQAAKQSPAPAATAAQKARPAAPPAPPAPPTPVQEFMDEPAIALEPAKAKLEWNATEQPVAFGTLLESPGGEAAADETVATSQRDPNLGEPAFWALQSGPEEAETDSEGSESQAPGGLDDEDQWLSAGRLEELPAETETVEGNPAPQKVSQAPNAELELPELTLPELAIPESPELANQPMGMQPVISLEGLEPEPLPQSPLPGSPEAQDVPVMSLDSVLPARRDEEPQEPEAAEAPQELTDFAWAAPNYAEERSQMVAPPEAASSSAPGKAEDSKESHAPAMATLAPFLASLTSAASARDADSPQDVAELGVIPAFPGNFPDDAGATEPVDVSPAAQLDPAVIEAIAQRVIERMQPKLIELVTRELLRPAVEALVQRELEKK